MTVLLTDKEPWKEATTEVDLKRKEIRQMSYQDVQTLHKQALLAMGMSEREAEEVMEVEEEYGVSYLETLKMMRDNPAAYEQMIDDYETSGFDYEGQ